MAQGFLDATLAAMETVEKTGLKADPLVTAGIVASVRAALTAGKSPEQAQQEAAHGAIEEVVKEAIETVQEALTEASRDVEPGKAPKEQAFGNTRSLDWGAGLGTPAQQRAATQAALGRTNPDLPDTVRDMALDALAPAPETPATGQRDLGMPADPSKQNTPDTKTTENPWSGDRKAPPTDFLEGWVGDGPFGSCGAATTPTIDPTTAKTTAHQARAARTKQQQPEREIPEPPEPTKTVTPEEEKPALPDDNDRDAPAGGYGGHSSGRTGFEGSPEMGGRRDDQNDVGAAAGNAEGSGDKDKAGDEPGDGDHFHQGGIVSDGDPATDGPMRVTLQEGEMVFSREGREGLGDELADLIDYVVDNDPARAAQVRRALDETLGDHPALDDAGIDALMNDPRYYTMGHPEREARVAEVKREILMSHPGYTNGRPCIEDGGPVVGNDPRRFGEDKPTVLPEGQRVFRRRMVGRYGANNLARLNAAARMGDHLTVARARRAVGRVFGIAMPFTDPELTALMNDRRHWDQNHPEFHSYRRWVMGEFERTFGQ